MNSRRSELLAFLQRWSDDQTNLSDSCDVFEKLGVDGDDAFELIDAFEAAFGVDMSNYRWYFHHGEEGMNLGGLVFRPPYMRVKTIPITMSLLLQAIETRRWSLVNPEHTLPSVRWDIWLARVLIILLIVWLVRQFIR